VTNYAKITLGVEVSESDDYQPADHRFGPEESETTPVNIIKGTGTAPTHPSVFTVPITDYTTIDSFAVVNTGATTTMEVYADIDATGATKFQVLPGKPLLLGAMDVGTDITMKCAADTTTFEFILLVTA
jgi:hypothetical protein